MYSIKREETSMFKLPLVPPHFAGGPLNVFGTFEVHYIHTFVYAPIIGLNRLNRLNKHQVSRLAYTIIRFNCLEQQPLSKISNNLIIGKPY